jgi:hypothetical protein
MKFSPFVLYSLLVAILFVLMGSYLLFFDKQMALNFGATKTKIFAGFVIAYGGFRFFRAYKIFQK